MRRPVGVQLKTLWKEMEALGPAARGSDVVAALDRLCSGAIPFLPGAVTQRNSLKERGIDDVILHLLVETMLVSQRHPRVSAGDFLVDPLLRLHSPKKAGSGPVPSETTADVVGGFLSLVRDPDVKAFLQSQSHKTREAFVVDLRGFRELSAVRSELPREGKFLRWLAKMPLAALLFVPLVPQILGSVISSSYNIMVKGLLPRPEIQRQSLIPQVLRYQTLTYAIALGISCWLLVPIIRELRRTREVGANGEWRKRAIRFPFWRALVSTANWLLAIPLFILSTYRRDGVLDTWAVTHFSLVILTCWLLATLYSLLVNFHLVLRILYPAFLEPKVGLRDLLASELAVLTRGLKLLQYVAAVIPLMASVTFLSLRPEALSPVAFKKMNDLLFGLLFAGTVGTAFCFYMASQLRASLEALTGKRQSRRWCRCAGVGFTPGGKRIVAA